MLRRTLLASCIYPPFRAAVAQNRPVFLVQSGGERLIAVVPLVGSGTPADPRRPLFAPMPGSKLTRSGIQSFSYQLTDDRKYAIAEFTAIERKAFDAVLKDSRVVKAFLKGRDRKEDAERELRKFKKDFRFSNEVSRP